MSFDDQFRPALDNLAARLQRDVARHLDAAMEELTARAEKAAESAESERVSAIEHAVREARFEAEQAAARHLAGSLADADRASTARLRSALDAAERAAEDRVARATTDAAERVEQSSRHAQIAAGQRLVNAFRSIDAAGSLHEILSALASAARAEAPRVALFLAAPGEIRSWRFLGFEPAIGADDSLSFPLADAGIIADAMSRGRAVVLSANGGLAAPAFADLPADRFAVAVPMIVNGEVVVVLYADEAEEGPAEHAAWPFAVEVLARHAARALEATTAHQVARTLRERSGAARPAPAYRTPVPASPVAAPALSAVPHVRETSGVPQMVSAAAAPAPLKVPNVVPMFASSFRASPAAPSNEDGHAAARAYAHELVSDIRARNGIAIAAAIQERTLMTRLGSEISKAWTLYEARVPQEIRANTNYFHSELVRTLADGDASLLTPEM